MANRKGAQFQPMAAEALGLSIHPTTNEVQSSPPLAAVPNSMVATAAAASASQPSSKRGSQIRQSSGGSGPLGPSALSQEVAPSTPEFHPHPPSPSHTASPPQASSNFSPSSQPLLQQSPQQMPTTGGTYGWTQNRVPPPTLNNTANAGPRLTSDSWAQPGSGVLIPPLGAKEQLLQSPPGPAVEEREEVLQHTPPRSNGDWSARGGGGTLADAMAQRTSPTAQLLQGSGNGVRAGGVNANRPRARGPTQSSSPVMMQAVRQAALQSSPPQLPAQPAVPVRGTPPSLQGLIAPNVNPPPPILPRANTENPAASAVAAGVRPLGGTPPNVNNTYSRNNTTSPPGTRNPSTTTSSTSSPPYHTPMESLQGATSYLSESSSYSALPFEYDQDDDDVQHKSPQQHYATQPQPDPRNRTSIDSYRRDQQDSPPPIHIRTLPNQAPTSVPQSQPHVPPPQPQVQTQAVPRPPLYTSQPASAVSGTGSHIRGPLARSFPVVHEFEEVDDEVVAVPQQKPAGRPQQTHSSSQPPPARWVGQSRERERSPEQVRAPSPPPAPPVQQPPIPIYQPQSVHGVPHAVLRDNSPRRDSSTPSPPAPLRINPDAGTRRAAEDEMEPAEPSSDSFTPKSPNVALPADHGHTYANNNYGRLGSHNRMPQAAPYSPVDPYASYGGSLQHALFAMQMGGMPAPRGPLATFNNYGSRESYPSLAGAAAALTGKPESPYPAPPLNNNVNGSSSKLGAGGFATTSAESGGSYNYDSSQSSQPWEGPEQISYADFVEWQRKMYSNRPDAPIPPTPQSYASPQQSINQHGFGGDQRNGNRENDGKGTQASNGHGYGSVPAYGNGYGPGGVLDPSMIPDRYIPSALSSYLSSPMMHNPFLPRFPAPQSLVSSPSHIPLDLGPAPLGPRRLHKKKSKRQLRGSGSGTSKGGASSSVPKTGSRLKESIQKPPTPPPAEEFPRVDSTVPKDTSSEESDTDDTKKGDSTRKAPPLTGPGPVVSETEEEDDDDDDVWQDESSEDELDSEYHSIYIQNPSKRKRKWENKWDTMVRLFQEIDRTTDSPMVLLAAPSTSPSPKTHILISRAIQRNPGKYMPHAQTARQAFGEIAKLRRKEKADAAAAERARRAAGFEQQLAQIPFLGPRWDSASADSGGRGSSSPGSAGFGPTLGGLEKLQDLPNLAAGGEDGLKQALSVALDSLKQMHIIYEQREERRREELERQRQEAAGLESLFRMMAIESAANSSQGSGPAGAGSPASSSGVATLSGKKSP
ncbi:hypothetical protein FRC01_001436 [Tulasnella sp. 417]|nr:hypothetical protein FRC01_001436 [Tulasnella sp. 417]